MDDIVSMHEHDGVNELKHVITSLGFCDCLALFVKLHHRLTTSFNLKSSNFIVIWPYLVGAKLKKNVNVVSVLEEALESDDMSMVDSLVDFDLGCELQ